jgi:hypothetical protein
MDKLGEKRIQTEFWREDLLGNGHLLNWEGNQEITCWFCSVMFVTISSVYLEARKKISDLITS